MATKRPILNQRIPAESAKPTTEVTPTAPVDVESVTEPEIVRSAEQPSEEQAAAEDTTDREELLEPREGSTPGTTVGVADDPTGADADPGLIGVDDGRPSKEELEERLGFGGGGGLGSEGGGGEGGGDQATEGGGGGDPTAEGGGGGRPGGGLTPGDDQSGDTPYGSKESMIGAGGGGAEAAGGRAEQGMAFLNSDGEVKKVVTVGQGDDDGMFLGFDTGAMAYDKEMDKVIAEREASGQGAAGGGAGGGTTGSGTPPSTTDDIDEKRNADGSTTTVKYDGTIITTYKDGTQIVNTKDGNKSYNADGTEMTAEEAAKHQAAKKAEEEAAEKKAEEDEAAKKKAEEDAKDDSSVPVDDEDAPPTEEEIKQAQAVYEQLGYSKRNPDDGATDPADDDAAFGAGVATQAPTGALAQQGKLGLIGQPGPDGWETGGGGGGGAGTDPNAGFTDPTPDADTAPQTSGREHDPFDGQQDTLEPPAETDTSDDADESASPFLETAIAGPVDDRPDIDQVDLDG